MQVSTPKVNKVYIGHGMRKLKQKQKQNIMKTTKNIYGVLSNGVHIDVSNSLQGAKIYATKHGYTTVTVRYNCGYIAQEIFHKYSGKWVACNV